MGNFSNILLENNQSFVNLLSKDGILLIKDHLNNVNDTDLANLIPSKKDIFKIDSIRLFYMKN